jgi:MoaA/NifB/PqqE/SkfB family radical SAM enzyme
MSLPLLFNVFIIQPFAVVVNCINSAMVNKFCKALSNRILFTNVGSFDAVKYKPCCFFTKDLPIENRQQFEKMRTFTSSINDWTSFCKRCKNYEDNGVKSTRLELNEEYLEEGIDLEIQMDRTCNAACITCGEWSSTTWQKYNRKINNLSTKFVIKPDVTSNLEKITELIDFNTINLRSIHILGGEPFANDSHLKILRQIPDSVAKGLELSYTTNGSYALDTECLDVFKKFREVNFAFSLDGIEDTFDYHRWPLIWNRVEENFEAILSYKDYNFSTSIGSTLTAFNVYYHDRLEHWVRQMESKYNRIIDIDFWPAVGVMSLAGVPSDLRNILNEKYSSNEKLINYIKSQPYTNYAFKELIKHADFHDEKRKLSWRDTFPEIKDFFNEL